MEGDFLQLDLGAPNNVGSLFYYQNGQKTLLRAKFDIYIGNSDAFSASYTTDNARFEWNEISSGVVPTDSAFGRYVILRVIEPGGTLEFY